MRFRSTIFVLLIIGCSAPVLGGGAWVPEPGHGDVQFGFSRKTAHTSWNAYGDDLDHFGRFQNHDFRYGYLATEIGLRPGWSASVLLTWLDGREGPDGDLHKNEGWSDAWFGLKYGWGPSHRPMALRLEVRSPVFYDISGPYTLELHDRDGNFVGNSPEWRGVLKHDVTLYWVHSRSLQGGAGWWTVEAGYTWREGAPADQLPVNLDAGWTLPWAGLMVKGSVVYRQSLGNDSARQPDDRFGSRSGYNFNDASMARGGLSLLLPLGDRGRWLAEAGYNMWFWGRSARQYEEPFASVSYRF
jgi:hypothetical protein